MISGKYGTTLPDDVVHRTEVFRGPLFVRVGVINVYEWTEMSCI